MYLYVYLHTHKLRNEQRNQLNTQTKTLTKKPNKYTDNETRQKPNKQGKQRNKETNKKKNKQTTAWTNKRNKPKKKHTQTQTYMQTKIYSSTHVAHTYMMIHARTTRLQATCFSNNKCNHLCANVLIQQNDTRRPQSQHKKIVSCQVSNWIAIHTPQLPQVKPAKSFRDRHYTPQCEAGTEISLAQAQAWTAQSLLTGCLVALQVVQGAFFSCLAYLQRLQPVWCKPGPLKGVPTDAWTQPSCLFLKSEPVDRRAASAANSPGL